MFVYYNVFQIVCFFLDKLYAFVLNAQKNFNCNRGLQFFVIGDTNIGQEYGTSFTLSALVINSFAYRCTLRLSNVHAIKAKKMSHLPTHLFLTVHSEMIQIGVIRE